jgi:preprotein translocase subunit SecD
MLARVAAFAVAAGFGVLLPAVAQDTPKHRVEFRRAETKPGPGLTEAVVVGSGDKVYLHKSAELTEVDVATARVSGDAGDRAIELTLTKAGAKKAAALSDAHADKPLAVLLDGRVLAAPVVRAKLGGAVRITGTFSAEDAAAFARAVGRK